MANETLTFRPSKDNKPLIAHIQAVGYCQQVNKRY